MGVDMWRDVVGWEGRYQVSSMGQVRSLPRTYDRNGSTVRINSRMLKPYLRNGYPTVTICKGDRGVKVYVHALVCAAFHGAPQFGQEVRHLDGDRLNNSHYNLCWGTHADNMRDKIGHGRSLAGEDSPHAKLTEGQVAYILRNLDRSCRSVARDIGMNFSTVHSVMVGKSWKHMRAEHG